MAFSTHDTLGTGCSGEKGSRGGRGGLGGYMCTSCSVSSAAPMYLPHWLRCLAACLRPQCQVCFIKKRLLCKISVGIYWQRKAQAVVPLSSHSCESTRVGVLGRGLLPSLGSASYSSFLPPSYPAYGLLYQRWLQEVCRNCIWLKMNREFSKINNAFILEMCLRIFHLWNQNLTSYFLLFSNIFPNFILCLLASS